ncbi:MAG: ribonuclease HI [Anaerolineales bacterium]|jgi:ribonuclease HI
MTDLPHVTIYTDGACDPNPGPGGWAALIFFKSRRKEISGSVKESTNNRMELTAAIKALETLNRECEIDFYTDSEYLKRGITEWLEIWRARNWRRKGGALKNVDLWQTLDKLIARHAIDWHWIRGHAGNRHNQRVDYLARKAIRR